MRLLLFIAFLGITSALNAQTSVNFTLRNNSLSSIYLEIPGVMNPNLSPMSNSGVGLKVGQKIFFFEGKKKFLLLEVTKKYAGKKVVVNELIRERRKELGLKK